MKVVEIEQKKGKYKYKKPLPVELESLKSDYEFINKNSLSKVVNEKDMYALLDRYARDLNISLYSIAEVLNISASTLNKLLKSQEYKEQYALAKKIRADQFEKEAISTASLPFDLLVAGNEISPILVKASQVKYNALIYASQSLDSEKIATRDKGNGDMSINIELKTPITVKDFSNAPEGKLIDVELKDES